MEMMNNTEEAKERFFKGKYIFAFYDETDENYIISFDNIKQICKYRKLELTQSNLTLISVEIYRALRREDHSTRILDGKLMHVYLVDIKEIENEN